MSGDKDCMDCNGSGLFYQMEDTFCPCVPIKVGDLVSFKEYYCEFEHVVKPLDEERNGKVTFIEEGNPLVNVSREFAKCRMDYVVPVHALVLRFKKV
jgi:hypothetical protein